MIGAPVSAADEDRRRRGLTPGWQQLSDDASATAWTLGQTMSVDQALAYDAVLDHEPEEVVEST
jgi:hypothetical protein